MNKKNSKSSLRLPKLSSSPSKGISRNKTKQYRTEDKASKLTAQAYGIYDSNLQPIVEFNTNTRREIASVTKMMTMLCTVRLCEKYKINMKKCYFRVTINASGVRGTSAELQSREWATIEDLLYGLMLPSGNDAATALAENLGACTYYDRLGQSHLLFDLKSLDLTDDTWNIKIYIQQFIKYMNTTAKELGLKETCYANPHGLDCSYRTEAYSTIQDQVLLAKIVSEQPQCLQIMSTHQHTAELKTIIGKEVQIRKKTWKNTHLLLNQPGFMGGKTGQTQNAGNCLATLFESQSKKRYIIVVLGCGSKELRFIETRWLVQTHITPKQK